MIYKCGDVQVNTGMRQATRGGATAHLTKKAFDLLVLLIEHRPSVVSKEEIHARLWPDTFVTESSVQALVSEIRQALDDESRSMVRTVHGVGYAFATELVEVAGDAKTRAVRAWLVAATWRVPLYDGDNVLGRGTEDAVPLDVPGISRRHARIRVGEEVTIEDLGSKNGTWLRDDRVTTPARLTDGDEVRLGSVLFTFRLARALDTTDTQAVEHTRR
jgi:DNA-binding winged helix-turn-helix (wHTH) protein